MSCDSPAGRAATKLDLTTPKSSHTPERCNAQAGQSAKHQ